MEKFIERVIKTLESNGFPSKKVSLPTEQMFEAADNKGISFNTVLEEMKTNLDIEADIGDDKIIFSKVNNGGIDAVDSANPFEGMDQADMMKKAQEMMAKMDPAELKRMQDMFMNMSEDEKSDIMEKGKDLGLM
jgi:hypothetical protein